MQQRFSKKREAILAILTAHHGALSAAEIREQLPDIDLVTIYRNLERFVSEKLVKKFHLGKSTEAVFEYQQTPHHHAICSDCEQIIHFTAPNKKIIELLDLKDFDVDDIEVIVKGRHKL